MEWLSWLIGILVAATILGWIIYVAGLGRLPLERRPKVDHFDRLGRKLAKAEAPDFHVLAGEPAEEEQ